MSKLYVFAIGGTGSRVLRSLTMLAAAGVKMGVDSIVPIIIDPDKSNADLTRTVTLMDSYSKVRQELEFTDSNKTSFFRCGLEQTIHNYTMTVKDTEDKKFRQFIQYSSLDREDKAMVNMLFSETNLEANMQVGFKGNPNIGSVVLNQIVASPEFDSFATSFQQGDKIFIISSIFGGTGASGFPLLLKTLRKIPEHKDINDAEIGAITMLPYFRLESQEASEIDSSTFISKARSALAYYEDNVVRNGDINSLYFLGDDISDTYEYHEGGVEQQNKAHLMELLAATAIVHFSHYSNSTRGRNYEFGIKDIGSNSAVTFAKFHEETTQMLRCPMTQFALMAHSLRKESKTCEFITSSTLKANCTLGTHIYSTPFFNVLQSFLSGYESWLEEMKDNTRSLDLFKQDCGAHLLNIVTDFKPVRAMLFDNDDEETLYTSLNKCIGKTQGKAESRFVEMFALATERLAIRKLKL